MAENRNGLTLLRSEDWMAVWLGFVIIAAVLLGGAAAIAEIQLGHGR